MYDELRIKFFIAAEQLLVALQEGVRHLNLNFDVRPLAEKEIIEAAAKIVSSGMIRLPGGPRIGEMRIACVVFVCLAGCPRESIENMKLFAEYGDFARQKSCFLMGANQEKFDVAYLARYSLECDHDTILSVCTDAQRRSCNHVTAVITAPSPVIPGVGKYGSMIHCSTDDIKLDNPVDCLTKYILFCAQQAVDRLPSLFEHIYADKSVVKSIPRPKKAANKKTRASCSDGDVVDGETVSLLPMEDVKISSVRYCGYGGLSKRE
jgi:hypothetical protein